MAPKLLGAAQAALASGVSQLTIDMSAVRFLDSTGLAMLVSASTEASRFRATLVQRAVPAKWLRVLTLTHTAPLFMIVE